MLVHLRSGHHVCKLSIQAERNMQRCVPSVQCCSGRDWSESSRVSVETLACPVSHGSGTHAIRAGVSTKNRKLASPNPSTHASSSVEPKLDSKEAVRQRPHVGALLIIGGTTMASLGVLPIQRHRYLLSIVLLPPLPPPPPPPPLPLLWLRLPGGCCRSMRAFRLRRDRLRGQKL